MCPLSQSKERKKNTQEMSVSWACWWCLWWWCHPPLIVIIPLSSSLLSVLSHRDPHCKQMLMAVVWVQFRCSSGFLVAPLVVVIPHTVLLLSFPPPPPIVVSSCAFCSLLPIVKIST